MRRIFRLNSIFAALLALCGVAAQAAAPKAPATWPAEIKALYNDQVAGCTNVGGKLEIDLAEYAKTGEINGDGKTDYVIQPSAIVCDQFGYSEWCGSAGCVIDVMLSGPTGYQNVFEDNAQAWDFVDAGQGRKNLSLSMHGITCGNKSGVDGCEMIYGWSGAKFARLDNAASKSAAATPASDAPRWSSATENDGIGKVASVKTDNLQDFAIIRCDKAGKASFIMGMDKIASVDNLPVKFTGATTGAIYQSVFRYRPDAKVWSMPASSELVSLLSGKDSKLLVDAQGRDQFSLSLAGSTKAIGDAMARCTQAALPATEADVRSFVNNGYAFYYRPLGSDPNAPGNFVFSSELEKLIDSAAETDPTFPGVDVFCKCQDFDEQRFRHQIANVALSGSRATVKVYVAAMGGPLTGDPVVMELLRLPSGKWVVDDIDGLKAEARSYAGQ